MSVVEPEGARTAQAVEVASPPKKSTKTAKTAEDHDGALEKVAMIWGKIAIPLKLVAVLIILAIGINAGITYSKTTIINRSTGKGTCCEKTCSAGNSEDLITTTFKSRTIQETLGAETIVIGITIGDCGNGDQTLWNGEVKKFNLTDYPDISFLVEDTDYATTAWWDQGYLYAFHELQTNKICDTADSFVAKYGQCIDQAGWQTAAGYYCANGYPEAQACITYADDVDVNGVGPEVACCMCGGGQATAAQGGSGGGSGSGTGTGTGTGSGTGTGTGTGTGSGTGTGTGSGTGTGTGTGTGSGTGTGTGTGSGGGSGGGGRKAQCIYGFEAKWNHEPEGDGAKHHFTVVRAYGIFNHATLKDIFLTNCALYEHDSTGSVLLMKDAIEESIFTSDTQLRVSAMAIDAYLASSRFRSVTSLSSFENNYDAMIRAYKAVLTNHLDASIAQVADVYRKILSQDTLEPYAEALVLDASRDWFHDMTSGMLFKDKGCIELCNSLDPVDCAYYSEPTLSQEFFYSISIMGAFGWVFTIGAVVLPKLVAGVLYKVDSIFMTLDGRLHGGTNIF